MTGGELLTAGGYLPLSMLIEDLEAALLTTGRVERATGHSAPANPA